MRIHFIADSFIDKMNLALKLDSHRRNKQKISLYIKTTCSSDRKQKVDIKDNTENQHI